MKKVRITLLNENPELASLCNYVTDTQCEFSVLGAEPESYYSDSLFLESSYELFRNSSIHHRLPSGTVKKAADMVVQRQRLLLGAKKIAVRQQFLENNTKQIAADKNQILNKKIHCDKIFSGIIGNSPQIYNVKKDIYFIKEKECKVLFIGESGTGKSMMARILHKTSLRKDGKYISVNIGAMPKDLIESTLFGTVKGAFTDARDKKGLVHLAENGTIFLDEIGEMPLDCQTKLLHTLDDGSFRRVGSDEEEKTNARFIFATNANLKELVKQKLFREDLYWRIAEFVINIPPLRSRDNDIILLAEYFLDMINARSAKEKKYFSERAKEKLENHFWPGNIRELKSCVEVATIYSQSAKIMPEDIHIEEM